MVDGKVSCAIQAEICNGLDDDGDGLIDEGLPVNDPTVDVDGDGFSLCPAPGDPVDCNDEIASINPAALEECNGIDDDCDGVIDEGCDALPPECSGVAENGVVNGTASDIRVNDTGLASVTLDAAATNLTLSVAVGFTPGAGSTTFTVSQADPTLPAGFEPPPPDVPVDCRVLTIDSTIAGSTEMTYVKDGPFDPALHLLLSSFDATTMTFPPFMDVTDSVTPGSTLLRGTGRWSPVKVTCARQNEICNGLDDDGDGLIDEGLPVTDPTVDVDGDGFSLCPAPGNPLDCNDQLAAVNPAAIEVCNGIDDDGDGLIDEGLPVGDPTIDEDGDGFALCPAAGSAFDCADQNAAINPAATEICDNGIDDDCHGLADLEAVECQNRPPVADVATVQLTDTGTDVLVRLDGSGSVDPDDPITSLGFRWAVDGGVSCDGSFTTCGTIEIALPLGSHTVTLRVTDPLGAFDEVTRTINLLPAALASLQIEDAKVKFDQGDARLQMSGEVGLPVGVNFSEVFAQADVDIQVAGLSILATPPVAIPFVPEGTQAKEWKFIDPMAPLGITKFNVDWKGMRFDATLASAPVTLKSRLIMTTETVLEIDLGEDKQGNLAMPGAFTLDIDGLGTVNVAADGTVTADVPIEIDVPEREFTVTVSGGLMDTSVITFSGTIMDQIVVGPHLVGSVGRFQIKVNIDPALFPAGMTTLPRTLDLDLAVGLQGFPGTATLGPLDLEVKSGEWRAKKERVPQVIGNKRRGACLLGSGLSDRLLSDRLRHHY